MNLCAGAGARLSVSVLTPGDGAGAVVEAALVAVAAASSETPATAIKGMAAPSEPESRSLSWKAVMTVRLIVVRASRRAGLFPAIKVWE
jgi:hypothetical protein